MAKHRTVNTHFWDDAYIETLSPNEILLFLFLITNPQTNIAGVYEITLNRIHERTKLSKVKIQEILEKFERDGKFIFRDNLMLAVNAIAHQKTDVPTIAKGIEIIVYNSPQWVKDRLCILYPSLSHLILSYSILSNGDAPQADPAPEPVPEKQDDLGKDLLIIQTESALKTKLELEEKRTVAEAIPPAFANDWGVYLKARVLKLGKNPQRHVLMQSLGYALTDYRRDHKKEYEQLGKNEPKLPTAAEVQQQREEWRKQPRTSPDGSTFIVQGVQEPGLDN